MSVPYEPHVLRGLEPSGQDPFRFLIGPNPYGGVSALSFHNIPIDGDAFSRIPANHPGLLYAGRNDLSMPDAPVLIWQGSGFRAVFPGRRIGFSFSSVRERNLFDVIVDGFSLLLRLDEGEGDYLLEAILPEGWHELRLSKRSEALFGTAAFRGLLLERGCEPGPAPLRLPLRLEFYGDSITAGACNGDSGVDQYDDLSTHSHLKAYPALTAAGLNAEYSCIAVSGTGVCYSWNPVLMSEVYDRLYPDKSSPRADFSGRPPDWVVLNLGQNDFGFPQSLGLRFPADYRKRYVRLVRGLRRIYPSGRIVCAIGGMPGWHESEELRQAFRSVVEELQVSDDRIFFHVFRVFSQTHPRTDVHAQMAEELTACLRSLMDSSFEESLRGGS